MKNIILLLIICFASLAVFIIHDYFIVSIILLIYVIVDRIYDLANDE